MSDRLLTITELAAKWGRPRTWVWTMVKTGGLPFVRTRRTHLIPEAAAEEWRQALVARRGEIPAAPATPERLSLREELKAWDIGPDDIDFVN